MTWILGGGAILCMIYYGIIIIYSGVSTSFSIIWPILALAFAGMAAASLYYQHHRDRIPLWVPVSAVTVMGAMALVFFIVEALILFGIATASKQSMEYVIVLGARIDGTKISRSLEKRLDKAIEYAQQNPNTILVLSGGQGKGEDIPEAEAMYQYLKFNGVSDDQILKETRSSSTVENIAYSRQVIKNHMEWRAMMGRMALMEGYQERADSDPVKVGIITSNFHIFRAKQIAKRWGIDNVYGIAAQTDPVLTVHLCVRECFAILKDKFMGNM